MSFTKMQDPSAVRKAMREYDRMGQEAFLAQYGFGPATVYVIEENGKWYDSKAILGVAYGYEFPEEGALKHTQFSGGANTVKRKLEALGFTVIVKPK